MVYWHRGLHPKLVQFLDKNYKPKQECDSYNIELLCSRMVHSHYHSHHEAYHTICTALPSNILIQQRDHVFSDRRQSSCLYKDTVLDPVHDYHQKSWLKKQDPPQRLCSPSTHIFEDTFEYRPQVDIYFWASLILWAIAHYQPMLGGTTILSHIVPRQYNIGRHCYK